MSIKCHLNNLTSIFKKKQCYNKSESIIRVFLKHATKTPLKQLMCQALSESHFPISASQSQIRDM